MREALAAEWLKTRTARSTWYVAGVVALFVALMLAIAWYFVATWDGLPPDVRAHAALGSLPDLLGWILSLVMAVFGALAITSEYSGGMIRTTFLAMPDRRAVMIAKALVAGIVTFVVAEAALGLTLVATAWLIGDRPIAGHWPPAPDDIAPIAALGGSVVAFALLGFGLGALTRSALASVVSLALIWYVVPLVAQHLPSPWDAWLTSVVPGALAGQLAGTGNANSVFGAVLPPWAALSAMLGYAIIPIVLAIVVVERRDA